MESAAVLGELEFTFQNLSNLKTPLLKTVYGE